MSMSIGYLYFLVMRCSKRLDTLRSMGAPDCIIRNEEELLQKRIEMLREACNAENN